jgi:hypothetical protein
MAARGPAPKDPEKRARRNATLPMTMLGTTPVKAPPLPRSAKYLKATKDWYGAWKTSPQASQFSTTDWQRLHMLAPLVDLYFRSPSKELFSEIRMTEANLGATVADRQRLRWTIPGRAEPAADEAPATPPRTPSRKRTDPRLRLVASA